MLGRYVFGTVFALAVWGWQGWPKLTRDMLPAHLTRGVLIAATAWLFFFSLTRLGLAEAITLSFIAPLLIPPLAHLFLGCAGVIRGLDSWPRSGCEDWRYPVMPPRAYQEDG